MLTKIACCAFNSNLVQIYILSSVKFIQEFCLMQNQILQFVKHQWKSILNIGINNNLDFFEKKKSQITNIIVATSIPIHLIFIIINFLQGRYLLLSLNLLLFVGSFFILIAHQHRKFLAVRLFINFFAIFFLSAEAILFRNGTEYFLFANLIVTIIFYGGKGITISISLLTTIAFILIKIILNSKFYFDAVSFERVVFNITWAILLCILALQYFIFQQSSYQQQIEEKNKELETSNKTKEKLFTVIAHDMRSPIALLKGSMDLLNKEYITQFEFKELSIDFTKQIDNLESNLDNLLIWSQSQMKGITVNARKVSARAVIEEVISLEKHYSNSKNIQLINNSKAEMVWIDPEHLKITLRNLISNAIKFSYKNSLIAINSSVSNNEMIISINDKGIGIPEEYIDKLFKNEFNRTTNGTNDEKGTGLGLKLCKEFLDKNNAEIWISSQKGIGSTFFISVPLWK